MYQTNRQGLIGYYSNLGLVCSKMDCGYLILPVWYTQKQSVSVVSEWFITFLLYHRTFFDQFSSFSFSLFISDGKSYQFFFLVTLCFVTCVY